MIALTNEVDSLITAVVLYITGACDRIIHLAPSSVVTYKSQCSFWGGCHVCVQYIANISPHNPVVHTDNIMPSTCPCPLAFDVSTQKYLGPT